MGGRLLLLQVSLVQKGVGFGASAMDMPRQRGSVCVVTWAVVAAVLVSVSCGERGLSIGPLCAPSAVVAAHCFQAFEGVLVFSRHGTQLNMIVISVLQPGPYTLWVCGIVTFVGSQACSGNVWNFALQIKEDIHIGKVSWCLVLLICIKATLSRHALFDCTAMMAQRHWMISGTAPLPADFFSLHAFWGL